MYTVRLNMIINMTPIFLAFRIHKEINKNWFILKTKIEKKGVFTLCIYLSYVGFDIWKDVSRLLSDLSMSANTTEI